MQAPWQVAQIQDRGDLPRVIVRDSTGRRFRLLFDAAAHPAMATGAAMVSSRLLHAFGYNVPHYWLRTITRDHLVLRPETFVTDTGLDSLLDCTTQRSDGTYRVLVSRIPGVEQRVGPFSFHGSRVDDANDVFPHEDRRELRALRVVVAWIHHSKIRERHTLDVGGGKRAIATVKDGGLYGTTSQTSTSPSQCGGRAQAPLVWTRAPVRVRSGASARRRGWAETTPPYWPALGHFEVEDFSAEQWRAEWPNPAFRRATPADAFWAAKKIRHVSRSDVAAIVETAGYSSQRMEDYVVETLVQRRNAIGQAYLGWGGGLGRFRVDGMTLRFRDLRAHYDYASDSAARTVTWHVFNNQEKSPESNSDGLSHARRPSPFRRAGRPSFGCNSRWVSERRHVSSCVAPSCRQHFSRR